MSRSAARRSDTGVFLLRPAFGGAETRTGLSSDLRRGGDRRRRGASSSGELLDAVEQAFLAVERGVAVEGVDQPADVGGDVVELFAQVRLLDAVAVPVGHDRAFDAEHLALQPLELVLELQLVGEQLLGLLLAALDDLRGFREQAVEPVLGIGDAGLGGDELVARLGRGVLGAGERCAQLGGSS